MHLDSFISPSSKEVGKQSSELQMTFTSATIHSMKVVWDFTSHKNTLNEGWCETLVWDLTSHKNTLNEGWCETLVWDFTSHKNTLNEGWCETVVWDVTSHNNSLKKAWCETVWCETVWCETWHHITIHSMKGDVRLWCETWHHITIHSMKLWWLHECCMGLVMGRKPEHETLYFSM